MVVAMIKWIVFAAMIGFVVGAVVGIIGANIAINNAIARRMGW
jgi:hypothetical protein